jgi:hypothetical protein
MSSPVSCAPNDPTCFSDLISCGSIAADGSDFKISGPQVIGITKAEVIVTMDSPKDCISSIHR